MWIQRQSARRRVSDTVMDESEEDFRKQFQDDPSDGWEDEPEMDAVPDGNPMTAKQFYSALEGYRKLVENTSHMILMAFDAATTGDCLWLNLRH